MLHSELLMLRRVVHIITTVLSKPEIITHFFGRGHPAVFELQRLNKIIYVFSLTQRYIYYINGY